MDLIPPRVTRAAILGFIHVPTLTGVRETMKFLTVQFSLFLCVLTLSSVTVTYTYIQFV
jgi:hypothetical protein